MKNKLKPVFFILLFLLGAMLFAIHSANAGTAGVFDPKGPIAVQERDLIVTAVLLMLIAVIPVYIMLFVFARKYRAGNTKAKYVPDLDNKIIAGFIWAIPGVIILMISVINWKSTHALDPTRPLLRQGSGGQALMIQVVALQWKWLFIYSEQHIATVNFVQFPARMPVHFELTADAPMNSFWIPQLGGQMYAMAGMETQLNLMADAPGEFRGSDAEISGAGFAGMHFVAKASSQADFDAWVASVKQSSTTLSLDAYNKLAEPSQNNPAASYASVENSLYTKIMAKFMAPPSTNPASAGQAMPVGN